VREGRQVVAVLFAGGDRGEHHRRVRRQGPQLRGGHLVELHGTSPTAGATRPAGRGLSHPAPPPPALAPPAPGQKPAARLETALVRFYYLPKIGVWDCYFGRGVPAERANVADEPKSRLRAPDPVVSAPAAGRRQRPGDRRPLRAEPGLRGQHP